MQTIVNLGTGGADLNGQNGSTTSADSNDALFLDWPGDNAGNYVYLPGVASNRVEVPDEAAFNISDLDIRILCSLDDWTPAASTSLISQAGAASSNFAWEVRVTSAGAIQFRHSVNGTTVVSPTAISPSPTLTDGVAYWVRITRVASTGVIEVGIATASATPPSVGDFVSQGTVTSTTGNLFDSTAALMLGTFAGTGNPAAGKFYRAQILDGIDGTTVLDVDASVILSGSATSFTALTGQTVTINRSTSGRKSVAVVSPVWLFGADDYMEVADNALLDFGASDSFTVLAVVRQWATPLNNGVFISKANQSNLNGYLLRQSGTNLQAITSISDGSNAASDTSDLFAAGSLTSIVGVVDRSAQTITAFINGVPAANPSSTSSVGSLISANPLRVGRRSGTGTAAYEEFELLSLAVFRRTLTAAEIVAISTYYQNRVA